jgi:hypothetical protein
VEAIPATTVDGDAAHGRFDADPPTFAEVDPGRLVGNTFSMRPVQPEQRLERRRLDLQSEPPQVEPAQLLSAMFQ